MIVKLGNVYNLNFNFIISVIFVSYTLFSSAQQNAIGIETGYGKSYIGESRIFPLNKFNYNAYKLGIRYYHTPINAPFNLYG